MKNVLIGVALIAGVIFVPLLLMFIIGLAFASALLFWALGRRITVTVNKRRIGYIRWFTYYPLR